MSQSTKILLPGEGTKYSVLGDVSCLKLSGANTGGRFALAENSAPPGGGPPPHVHQREDELFYVLTGEYEFTFEETVQRGGPGTALYLPRGRVHTFKNVGPTRSRFIVCAAPAGFDAFVAAVGCACADADNPPAVQPADVEKLMAVCPQFGIDLFPQHQATRPAPPRPVDRAYWVLGEHVRIKLDSEQTLGNFSVVEVTSLPGGVVPQHLHVEMDEVFYILEGAYEFTVAGTTTRAEMGTLLYVPRGVLHGFRNAAAGASRLLDFHTPGGFEKFFEELGTPCSVDAWKTEQPAPMPEMPKVFEMFTKHGMVVPRP